MGVRNAVQSCPHFHRSFIGAFLCNHPRQCKYNFGIFITLYLDLGGGGGGLV